jgi:hypothetical protein
MLSVISGAVGSLLGGVGMGGCGHGGGGGIGIALVERIIVSLRSLTVGRISTSSLFSATPVIKILMVAS